MTIYEYRCPECSTHVGSQRRDNTIDGTCPACGDERTFKRVWSVSLHPPMMEHYNRAVGKPISSMRQFKAELKTQSLLAEERLGMPVDYQPIDLNDPASIGVTNEGIEESNKIRAKTGAPLLPEIK